MILHVRDVIDGKTCYVLETGCFFFSETLIVPDEFLTFEATTSKMLIAKHILENPVSDLRKKIRLEVNCFALSEKYNETLRINYTHSRLGEEKNTSSQ